METGWNKNEPVREVRHADLTRVGDSAYRSECPACDEGILLVAREPNTFVLMELDHCIICAQRFRYTDIADMRSRDL